MNSIQHEVFNAVKIRTNPTAKDIAEATGIEYERVRNALWVLKQCGMVTRSGKHPKFYWQAVEGIDKPFYRPGENPGSASGRELGPREVVRLSQLGRRHVTDDELLGKNGTEVAAYLVAIGREIIAKGSRSKNEDCSMWNILKGKLIGRQKLDDLKDIWLGNQRI